MGMAKDGDAGGHLPGSVVKVVEIPLYPVLMAMNHIYTLAGQLQEQLGRLSFLGVTITGHSIKRDIERLCNPPGIGIEIPGMYDMIRPILRQYPADAGDAGMSIADDSNPHEMASL
jgi:hypothetical protein